MAKKGGKKYLFVPLSQIFIPGRWRSKNILDLFFLKKILAKCGNQIVCFPDLVSAVFLFKSTKYLADPIIAAIVFGKIGKLKPFFQCLHQLYPFIWGS